MLGILGRLAPRDGPPERAHRFNEAGHNPDTDGPDTDGVGRAPDRAPAFGIVADYCFMMLTYLPPITLRMAVAPEPSPTSFIVVSPETPL